MTYRRSLGRTDSEIVDTALSKCTRSGHRAVLVKIVSAQLDRSPTITASVGHKVRDSDYSTNSRRTQPSDIASVLSEAREMPSECKCVCAWGMWTGATYRSGHTRGRQIGYAGSVVVVLDTRPPCAMQ